MGAPSCAAADALYEADGCWAAGIERRGSDLEERVLLARALMRLLCQMRWQGPVPSELWPISSPALTAIQQLLSRDEAQAS